MRYVRTLIDMLGLHYRGHSFLQWLGSGAGDDATEEQKLWFGLFAMGFIMQFRDLNAYHTSYGADEGLDRQRRALSAHAAEDMTHSRLFVMDSGTLGWARLTGWRPSQVLHWLFTNPATEPDRARTARLNRLLINASDPVIRFSVVEAVETSGNACFTQAVVPARQFAAASGRELMYWGDYHLERESGHAAGEDESAFDDVALTESQRVAATYAVTEVFQLFEEQNDDFFRLTQQAISCGGLDYLAGLPVEAPPHDDMGAAAVERLLTPGAPHPAQREILDCLTGACSALSASARVLLHSSRDGPDTGTARLRTGLLLSVLDDLAWPTYVRHVLPYGTSAHTAERAVNRLAARLGAVTPCHETDWAALDLDEHVPHPLERTLEFLYLDEVTEPSRDMRAVVTAQLASRSTPLQRYWTVVALHALTNLRRKTLAELARVSVPGLLESLPYLRGAAGRRIPSMAPDPRADAVRFAALPADSSTVTSVCAAVSAIAETVERSLRIIAEVRP